MNVDKRTSIGGWQTLHPDLLQHIICLLGCPDIARARLLNKHWRDNASSETHQLVLHRRPEQPPPDPTQLVSLFANLTSLHLHGAHNQPMQGLAALARLSRLTSLTLERWGFYHCEDPVTMRELWRFSGLRELALLKCRVEQAPAPAEDCLPELRHLFEESEDGEAGAAEEAGGPSSEESHPLPELRHLHLSISSSCNCLQQLEALGTFPTLASLQLETGPMLRTLPANVYARFPALQRLAVTGSDALWRLALPVALKDSLESFSISSVPLRELSEELGQLSCLKALNIEACHKLGRMPESLGDLAALTSLKVSSCERLAQLPESLSKLSALRELKSGQWLRQQDELVLAPLQQLESAVFTCSKLSLGTGLASLAQLEWQSAVFSSQAPRHGGVGIGNIDDEFDSESDEEMGDLLMGGLFAGAGADAPPPQEGAEAGGSNVNDAALAEAAAFDATFAAMPALAGLVLTKFTAQEGLPGSLCQLSQLSHLVLSEGAGLKRLPEAFGELPALKLLKISDCKQLEELPGSLGQLGNLERLILIACEALTGLPDSIGQLSSLVELSISACARMQSLPGSIGQLHRLQALTIKSCHDLAELPELLGNACSIRRLFLEDCVELKYLPGSLGGLYKLEELTISNLNIFALPDSLGLCFRLARLIIHECPNLVYLPEALAELPSLASLQLSSCRQLVLLPEMLPYLPALRLLKIAECNELCMLPEGLGALSELRELELVGCRQLAALPSSFAELSALDSLTIKDCPQLAAAPYTMCNLFAPMKVMLDGFDGAVLPGNQAAFPAAHSLTISCCNNLVYLPHELGSDLQGVRKIEIINCPQLTQLPESLCQLPYLHTLRVSKCAQLEALPESLGQLSALRHLSADSCPELFTLPESLGELAQLETLSLARSELQALPESIGQLHITRLVLKRLPLVALPESFGEMASLRCLEIGECSLLEWLPESLGDLSSLAYFGMQQCERVARIPDSAVRLLDSSLRVLRVVDCGPIGIPEALQAKLRTS